MGDFSNAQFLQQHNLVAKANVLHILKPCYYKLKSRIIQDAVYSWRRESPDCKNSSTYRSSKCLSGSLIVFFHSPPPKSGKTDYKPNSYNSLGRIKSGVTSLAPGSYILTLKNVKRICISCSFQEQTFKESDKVLIKRIVLDHFWFSDKVWFPVLSSLTHSMSVSSQPQLGSLSEKNTTFNKTVKQKNGNKYMISHFAELVSSCKIVPWGKIEIKHHKFCWRGYFQDFFILKSPTTIQHSQFC